jgi:uncharacterized protein YbjT (DUF2867 family)
VSDSSTTIVVTGATGFTGPFVIRELRRRFPHALIRAVVRSTSRKDHIAMPGVAILEADLRDGLALRRAFTGGDALVNVASLGFDWVDTILRAAEDSNIKRAIFIGTTAMLTKLPVSSKPIRERAELAVRASTLDWTILRPTMIYGTPDDRNIARLISFIARFPVVPLIAENALQQPVHVEDVATAVAEALACPATVGRVYNLSGEEPIRLGALVEEVAQTLGRRPLIVKLPIAPIVKVIGWWNRIGRAPLKTEQVMRIAEDKHFSHTEAARDFGFCPRSFSAGVRGEVQLWRARAEGDATKH